MMSFTLLRNSTVDRGHRWAPMEEKVRSRLTAESAQAHESRMPDRMPTSVLVLISAAALVVIGTPMLYGIMFLRMLGR